MARRADLVAAATARFDRRSRRHWSWLTAACAGVAAGAVYAGFLGTDPFESENLFVYAALALFVGVAVVALGLGGAAAPGTGREHVLGGAAVAGAACALVADVVGEGGTTPTVVALLGAAGAALSAARWPTDLDAP